MSKEIDLIKNIINEVDTNLYSVYGNAPQILITDKLRDLLLRLDTPEVRYFFENYNQQAQRIAELEEQLKNSRVKYFIGFDSDFNTAVKELDLNIVLPNWMHDKEFKFYDTKEEAQAKLKELKGERE